MSLGQVGIFVSWCFVLVGGGKINSNMVLEFHHDNPHHHRCPPAREKDEDAQKVPPTGLVLRVDHECIMFPYLAYRSQVSERPQELNFYKET